MSYIPHTRKDIEQMQRFVGISSIEELFVDIPRDKLLKKALHLPAPLSEGLLFKELKRLAAKNQPLEEAISFLGAGSYNHFIPSAVHFLLSRGEFFTAYTPYQPEVSQGTLQCIYEFQTMVCNLTGMDVANASHYDGATAAAEAAIMAANITGRHKILVSQALHPEYRSVLSTYLEGRGLFLKEVDCREGITCQKHLLSLLDKDTAAVMVQYPNFLGVIEKLDVIKQAIDEVCALLIVIVVEAVALGLLTPPGALGADIVAGEGQSWGIPLSFGGPYLGFMATRKRYMRQLPGRLVGATCDIQGKKGYVLTLQAREQHIRREKATSNICSNQALCALAATIFLSLLGSEGLKEMAYQCYQKAHYAFELWKELSVFEPVLAQPFFHEFPLRTSLPPRILNEALRQQGIYVGYYLGKDYPQLEDCFLFCVTEKNTREEIILFKEVVEKIVV